MKNIYLFLLLHFAFAKISIAAVPIQVKTTCIAIAKDSTTHKKTKNLHIANAQKKVLLLLKKVKRASLLALVVSVFFIILTINYAFGGGFVLAMILYGIGLLLNISIIANLIRVRIFLRKILELQDNSAVLDSLFSAEKRTAILFCLYLLSALLALVTISFESAPISGLIKNTIIAITALLIFLLVDFAFFKTKP